MIARSLLSVGVHYVQSTWWVGLMLAASQASDRERQAGYSLTTCGKSVPMGTF